MAIEPRRRVGDWLEPTTWEELQTMGAFGPSGTVSELPPPPDEEPVVAPLPDEPRRESLARYRDVMSRRPEQKPPSTGRRIAAALAAAGAGWVNAGGRTRVADPSQAILEGGNQDYRRWEDEALGAEQNLRLAGQDAAITRESEDLNLRRRRDAREEEDTRRRRTQQDWEFGEKKRQAGRSKFHNVGGVGMVEETPEGKVKPVPGTAPTRREPETEESKAQARKRIADAYGERWTAEQRSTYIATGRMPTQPRPRQENPNAVTPDERRQSDFAGVEDWKQGQLRAAETAHRKRVADGTVDEKTSLAQLEDEKANIQRGYESKIKARGGSVKVFPVAKLAAFAAKQGMTEEQAKKALIDDGWQVR